MTNAEKIHVYLAEGEQKFHLFPEDQLFEALMESDAVVTYLPGHWIFCVGRDIDHGVRWKSLNQGESF